MAVDRDLIKRWFKEGVEKKATHMIVVCDTFDHGDFPVYVKPRENSREIAKKEGEKPMQRVMEVYSLSLDVDAQYDEPRAFNYE